MMFGKGHQGNMRSSKYAYWTTAELLARLKELSRKGHLTADEKKEKKEIVTELKARGERNPAKRKGYAHSHFSLSSIASTITSTPTIWETDTICKRYIGYYDGGNCSASRAAGTLTSNKALILTYNDVEFTVTLTSPIVIINQDP